MADSLVAVALPRIDYRDAMRVRLTKGRFADIDAFARRFFLSQPAWLRAISMSAPSGTKLARAVAQTRFEAGDRIGSWRVYERDHREIVFGESLGFMTYRFSLRLERGANEDAVEASTAACVTGLLGRAYFAAVRLVHKAFVRMALRNALKA